MVEFKHFQVYDETYELLTDDFLKLGYYIKHYNWNAKYAL